MSDVPVEVIVAAFQSEDGAKQALSELKQAKHEGLIKIDDAAVISKDAKGKLHIKETADMSTGKGAGIGAVIGGVVGLLAGPLGVGLGAAAGAAIGGIASHGDAGFKDERLETIGAGLEPGTSAIVAVVEHQWVAAVQEALEEEATDVMAQRLSADIHEQLTSGKEVAYSAIAAEGAASVSRTAGDEHEVEQESMVVTEDGITAEKIVANEEGVTAVRYIETDDAVEVIEAVVDTEGAAVIDAVVTEDEAVVVAAVLTPEEEDDGEESDSDEDSDDAGDEDQDQEAAA